MPEGALRGRTNDHRAGLQGIGRTDRLRRVVSGTCPYVRDNLAAYRRQRLRPARQGTLIASRAEGDLYQRH